MPSLFGRRNGTGGKGIYGTEFPDENFALKHTGSLRSGWDVNSIVLNVWVLELRAYFALKMWINSGIA